MVGQITYTEDQILFILRLTLDKINRESILREYKKRFNKTLTPAQLRYVKSKYGHDPEFGTALINGSLPDNGGNRKTAPPSPETNTSNFRETPSFYEPAGDTSSMPPYSLAPLAPATKQQLNIPLPPLSDLFPRHPQQTQSPSQTDTHSHSTLATSALFTMPAVVPRLPAREAPIWNPNNPYGVQPVLQQYELDLQTNSNKRKLKGYQEEIEGEPSPSSAVGVQHTDPKRLELDGEGNPTPERRYEDFEDATTNRTPGLDDATAARDIGTKRLKLESPTVMPKPEDQYDSPVSMQNNISAPEVYNGPEADRLLNELLDHIDAETKARDTSATPSIPTMPSASTPSTMASVSSMYAAQATPCFQTPQINVNNPYSYGPVNYGKLTSIMPFSATNPIAVSPQSNPGLTYSEIDTNPSWSPCLDNIDPGSYWGSVPNPSTYAFSALNAYCPVVDPALAPYLDPALMGSVGSPGNATTESRDQWGLAVDAAQLTFPNPVVNPALASDIGHVLLGTVSNGTGTTTEPHNQQGHVPLRGILSPPEEYQSGGQDNADAFMGFDWGQMVSFDGNTTSDNDAFQHYPPLE